MLPIGQAIPFTERRLRQGSQVTEADIAFAVPIWKRYAPPPFRNIIEGDPAYRFNPTRRVYIYASNGQAIDPQRFRALVIEPFLRNIQAAMREISKRLQDRRITLPEWQAEMESMVKASQLAVALVANGGIGNNDDDDRTAIALGIFAMLVFLAGFARDIQTGSQPMNGLLLSRTDLYAFGGRDAYEEARRNGHIFHTDATTERRVLMPGADHCHTQDGQEGCVELAALGWVRIGTLPRIYDTPCRTNCMCHFEFR